MSSNGHHTNVDDMCVELMTEYQQYGLARQETKCVQPGLWIVDGHTCRRHQSGWWTITKFDEHGIVQVIGGKAFRTLRDAREFLYEQCGYGY